MNWIKWWLYLLIYLLLAIAFYPLLENLGISIKDIYNWTTKLVWELSVATSILVEWIMVIVIWILFFLPISSKDGRLNSSLNYFIDAVSTSIDGLLKGQTQDKSIRNAKLISLSYNMIILLIITFVYFALIIKTKTILNWLELIYYWIFIFILIFIVNFITSVIAQLDEAEKSNNLSISINFLEKKNLLTLWLLFWLIIFLSLWDNITLSIYDKTNDLPLIELLDGKRIDASER